MIILASKSPRRQELLARLGLDFTVMTEDVDETMDPDLPLEQEIVRVSASKARAVQDRAGPDDLIISADTVV
ncbi:MAG: Maf family protein, partial [Oscillospiraceae bacterium]|nr:Maf family protein [Oscillospiraceae bacterium]